VSTGFSDQHSAVEFPSQTLVDGARLELALHGCRPWVIPLYEPPIWGEMRESNSRDWSHNPVPKPFGQSRHRTWSCWLDSHQHRPAYKAGAFVCRPQQQTLELARRFERRSRTYEARALPTELHQHTFFKHLEAVGRIALPMICSAGRCLAVLATPPQTYLLTWSGRRDSNPRSRRW
jgi:hypothetical protein